MSFSASRFFAYLMGKPDPLRCCFPLFPRRVARERAMLFRGNSPFSACAALRARQSPCSKCAHRKVRFSVAGIKLYLGAASRCRAMLFRGNSPFSACAALRARQSPCSKCAHRKVRFSVAGIKLIWVQRHAAALCFSAEIHSFPPALRSVQGSRLAQSALTEKCDFRWQEIT